MLDKNYIAVKKTDDMRGTALVEGNRDKVVEWLQSQESVHGLMVWVRPINAYFTARRYLSILKGKYTGDVFQALVMGKTDEEINEIVSRKWRKGETDVTKAWISNGELEAAKGWISNAITDAAIAGKSTEEIAELVKISQRIIESCKKDDFVPRYWGVARIVKEAIELGLANPEGTDMTDAVYGYTAEIIERMTGKDSTEDPLAGCVPKYYEINPETETVLHNGTLLVDGMKILVEDPMHRTQISDEMSEAEVYSARMCNRWMTVESAKVVEHRFNGPEITFIGVYDDGIKRKWAQSAAWGWVVKKDTIPRMDTIITDEIESAPVYTGPIKEVLTRLMILGTSYKLDNIAVSIGGSGEVVTAKYYLQVQGDISKPAPMTEEVLTGKVFDQNYNIVWEGNSLTGMEEYIKNSVDPKRYGSWKVQPASYQEPVTILQYLRAIGEEKTYEILDVTGQVFVGNKSGALKWLSERSRAHLLDMTVFENCEDGMEQKSAFDFLKENNTRIEEDFKDRVINSKKTVVIAGTPDVVMEWLNGLPKGMKNQFMVRPAGKNEAYSVETYLKSAEGTE